MTTRKTTRKFEITFFVEVSDAKLMAMAHNKMARAATAAEDAEVVVEKMVTDAWDDGRRGSDDFVDSYGFSAVEVR